MFPTEIPDAIPDAIDLAFDSGDPEVPNCPRPESYNPVLFLISSEVHEPTFNILRTADCYRQETPWFYPVGMGSGHVSVWCNGREFLEGISQHALWGLRSGQGRLLIANTQEGTPADDRLFRTIHESLAYHGISPTRVVFTTANLLAEDAYDRWCNANGVHKRITVIAFNYFESVVSSRIIKGRDYLTEDDFIRLLKVQRPYKYICLNRRPHAHRLLAVRSLYAMGELDSGLVSMPGGIRSWHWTKDGQRHTEFSSDEFPDRDRSLPLRIKIPKKLLDRFPLHVDVESFEYNHAHTITSWPYRVTYLNIVTETVVMDDDVLFLTEKTYKAMANFQPFVVLGTRNTLDLLRRDGFRTFDLDEFYDEMEDPIARTMTALRQIEKLLSMDIKQMHEWYWGQLDVLMHNRRLLEKKAENSLSFLQRLTGCLSRG